MHGGAGGAAGSGGGESSASDDESDGSSTPSGSSGIPSDKTIATLLVEHEGPHSPGGTPPASDAEIEGLVADEPGAIDGPAAVVDEAAGIGPDPMPVPLLDPVVALKPAHACGVNRAEIAPTGKAKCFFCAAPIPRNSVRFAYAPSMAVERFMHAACFPSIPLHHLAHSRLALTYQLDYGGVGPGGAALLEAIESALA